MQTTNWCQQLVHWCSE